MPVFYSSMDLRQLRTFVHVAELGSLSKAADRLRIAQPALSRQMRILEHELKVPLFTRHGRGMVLTSSGEMLLARVAAVLRDLEAARADVAAESGVVSGQVVLGTPPSVGDVLSARLVERFLGLHPNVFIRIVPAFSGYLLDWLQRGEIDLAVMYEPEARQNLRIEPLITENLFLVGKVEPKPVRKRQVQLAKVLERRLILPSPQHGLRKLVERAARKLDRTLDIVVEADSLQTMKDLVTRGLGWTILPFASVHREVSEGRLSAVPISTPQLTRTLVIAESLSRQTSRAARLFRETLRAEVHDMVKNRILTGTLLK
jgi:LysR family transcriptional regulator, nitrogen assimilation regulatory protein